jgi:hypothetical protein
MSTFPLKSTHDPVKAYFAALASEPRPVVNFMASQDPLVQVISSRSSTLVECKGCIGLASG